MEKFIENKGNQLVLHNGFRVNSTDAVAEIKKILDHLTGKNHIITSTFDGEIAVVTNDGEITNVPIGDWFVYSDDHARFITDEEFKEYYDL